MIQREPGDFLDLVLVLGQGARPGVRDTAVTW
jgi:hypothetical protein